MDCRPSEERSQKVMGQMDRGKGTLPSSIRPPLPLSLPFTVHSPHSQHTCPWISAPLCGWSKPQWHNERLGSQKHGKYFLIIFRLLINFSELGGDAHDLSIVFLCSADLSQMVQYMNFHNTWDIFVTRSNCSTEVCGALQDMVQYQRILKQDETFIERKEKHAAMKKACMLFFYPWLMVVEYVGFLKNPYIRQMMVREDYGWRKNGSRNKKRGAWLSADPLLVGHRGVSWNGRQQPIGMQNGMRREEGREPKWDSYMQNVWNKDVLWLYERTGVPSLHFHCCQSTHLALCGIWGSEPVRRDLDLQLNRDESRKYTENVSGIR